MIINSNIQSFTSLNSAIKVTQNTSTDSSSKKLSDAVSVNISSNATSNTNSLLNSLKEETVIQSRNDYKGDSDKRAAIHKAYYTQVTNENKKFANPYVAAERGFVDEIIEPAETRPKLIRALSLLQNKRDTNPPKKHGNIPL